MSGGAGERTHVGRRVHDRYRIVDELGSGALGTVCVAEDETTAQRVAIRFLPRDLAAAPNVVRAVQSMGRSIAAASAGATGLVRVLELGEAEPGQPFAVMELLEGRLLSDVMTGSRALDVGRARRWAVGLGGAVEALHNVGLVYGRLRPRNVMVLPDGQVKLMDVELTGLLGTSAPQNVLDLSPAEYLAPEQIRRAPVTEKTDIYALAAIVYEMFSGAPPFQAPTRDALIAKHLSEPPPPMARRRAPASAERIVMQALEKDPERRPWMHDLLNGLWEEPNVPETRGWKRPAAVGAGVALAASIAALGIWGLLAPRQPAVHSVQPTVPPAEQAPTGARTIASPPSSPAPVLTRTESAAKPSAPVMVSEPAMPVKPASVPQAPPARPTPSAPAGEPRVAPVPVTPASPSQLSTEPVKATPPAAPPSPRVAGVASSGLASAPVSAEVQPHRRTYRVGWLDSGRATAQYQEIVKQALVGYPRDVAFEYRSADGQTARLQGFAAELVQLNVDVVFAVGNQAIQAAKQATTTIPIVMLGSDAVRRDESNANMTGVTYSSADLARGWLSLLKEIRPLSRVAVVSGADPASRAELTNLQTAAANAGVKIQSYAVHDGDALGSLFAGPPAERAEAIIVPGGPVTLAYLPRIVDLASRAKVPTVYGSSEFVEAGGLLAYGPSTSAMYRRAGAYIGKILGPKNPRELPIEQPSRFELVVNLKTARALGLTLPSSLVLRADRVLQ
jgi:putative ABC transport system substrate-binding protein